MILRELERKDLDEVLNIENMRFSSGWTESDFVNALKTKGIIGKVAFDGRVFGYIVYSKYGSFDKRFGIRILNIASLTLRIGTGRWMLNNLTNCTKTARIMESNLEGQLFFQAMGFNCAKIEKDFYPNGEAAYLFISGKQGYLDK